MPVENTTPAEPKATVPQAEAAGFLDDIKIVDEGAAPPTDPKIEWFEDELFPRFDVLGAALTAAATSMTVTNYKYFRKDDYVKVNKKEIVCVTATPTSTTVAIARAKGEESAVAAGNGTQLHILSNVPNICA